MQPVKSVFGVIGALLPVLYCGGLFWYFSNFGGVEFATALGLGPTMLGLGIVGVLFSIPLILKLTRIFSAPAASAPRVAALEAGSDSGFDADAVMARYLERRAAEGAPAAPASPASPGGFGRKGQ